MKGAGDITNINELLTKRGMPSNIDAEKALLGAILINNSLFFEIQQMVSASDFYMPSHQSLFQAISDMLMKSETADVVTITDNLSIFGALDKAGGAAYISSLIDGMPRLSNIKEYAALIKEKSTIRSLISAANNIIQSCFTGAESIDDLVGSAEKSILEINIDKLQGGLVPLNMIAQKAQETLDALHSDRKALPGIITDYVSLNDLTGGFHPSELVIVAARPSKGKTAFAVNVAIKAAKEGKFVAFFSLEMAAEELFFRILASESHLDLHLMRKGMIRREERVKANNKIAELANFPLYVDDSNPLTIIDIASKLRRLRSTTGKIDLIIVDYLQLMKGIGRQENRTQEISGISRGLKEIAKEFRVPVIALSQLSRAVEQRGEDSEPLLSDLRESGSIEQDADLVIFIHHPESKKDSPSKRNLFKFIIGKQRNGPVDSFSLLFLRSYATFVNPTREEYE